MTDRRVACGRRVTAARRGVAAFNLVLGGASLVRPRQTARALMLGYRTVPDTRIVRVLGARQVLQGVVLTLRPDRGLFGAGAVVDLLHAASLLPVVAASSRYRRAALISALLATASAAASVRVQGPVEPVAITAR